MSDRSDELQPTPELEPATFDPDEERAFAPKGVWKWIVGISLGLAVVVGGYQWRDRTRQAEIHDSIIRRYAEAVVPGANVVNPFAEKIEAWMMEVADDVPETYADPRLNLAGLHEASGIYLRIHADSITDDRMSIRDSALTMEPDAIMQCLGFAPLSLRGFYERIELVQPIWVDTMEEADTVLRLRVFEDELERRIERDLPLLLDVTRSDYFMLAIQHGDNRREHPVDIYLWDLHSDRLLLKGRMQARGTLIPIRVALGDTPYGHTRPLAQRAGVSDCSIASQIRAAAGRGEITVQSAMPEGPVIAREEEEDEAEANEEGEPGSTALAADGQAGSEEEQDPAEAGEPPAE